MNHRFTTPERRRRFAKETQAARSLAEQARKHAADVFARRFLPIILDMRRRGIGLTAIANQMNERGYRSRRGSVWTDQTVRQMLKRRVMHIRGIEAEVLGTTRRAITKPKAESRLPGWKRL